MGTTRARRPSLSKRAHSAFCEGGVTSGHPSDDVTRNAVRADVTTSCLD
ncbi:hypothetical protein [Streptomyces graminilatus]|nr:hypothetical protein [Streptomyces graminilatus]